MFVLDSILEARYMLHCNSSAVFSNHVSLLYSFGIPLSDSSHVDY